MLLSQVAEWKLETKADCIQVRLSNTIRKDKFFTQQCSAMRQTWEEIGVDLAEKDFMLIGQLDDREITTSLGKRLLMILSPFGERNSF